MSEDKIKVRKIQIIKNHISALLTAILKDQLIIVYYFLS